MHGPKPQAAKILDALDRAVDLVDTGAHPTDAVCKAASEQQLAPNYGRVLARAYNSGRTASQHEIGQDAFQKSAEFDMADPEEVYSRLGVALSKTAAAAVRSGPVSDEYNHPPAFLEDARRLQKLAEVSGSETVSYNTTDRYSDDDFRKAMSAATRHLQKAAQCRELLEAMAHALEARVDKLAWALGPAGAPSVNTLRKTAELRQDTNVKAVLDELLRRRPILAKCAASRSPMLTESELNTYHELADLADSVLELKTGERMLLKAAAVARLQAEAEIMAIPGLPSPDRGPFDELNGLPTVRQKIAVELVDSLLKGIGLGHILSPSGGPGQNSDVNAYSQALADPDHERKLHAIRSRTAAEQLMSADPVVSGYPTEDVLDAYNSITAAAPRMANQPMQMQAMVRRYLAQGGALDPDDVRANVYGGDKSIQDISTARVPVGGGELNWGGGVPSKATAFGDQLSRAWAPLPGAAQSIFGS